MSVDPAVAAVRLAVRRALADLDGSEPVPVLVACSGGADSLALLAATVFEARRTCWEVVGVTVDHGLQAGSADRAAAVVEQMAALGTRRTVTVEVEVTTSGQGPEAAAREARYAALADAARRAGSEVVLLGHTRDDQAETVLLGLTRGSGGRSMAGMRPRTPPFRRPLLDVTRAQTEAACRAEGIAFWSDPHNEDPRFTRSRVRHVVLPTLERELGPGIAAALARTADQLREDADALDGEAERALPEVRTPTGLDVAALGRLSAAVRRRVLRRAAVDAGSPPSELFRVHVLAVDDLVHSYTGQRWVELPGHVRVTREHGELRCHRTGGPERRPPVAG
jgi:tRNA(Ile)-lysidine synthase